jgi:hypothetical protein
MASVGELQILSLRVQFPLDSFIETSDSVHPGKAAPLQMHKIVDNEHSFITIISDNSRFVQFFINYYSPQKYYFASYLVAIMKLCSFV